MPSTITIGRRGGVANNEIPVPRTSLSAAGAAIPSSILIVHLRDRRNAPPHARFSSALISLDALIAIVKCLIEGPCYLGAL
jgi:hypothetical protein